MGARYATRFGVNDEVYGYRVILALDVQHLREILRETIRSDAASCGLDAFALEVDITAPFELPRSTIITPR